MEYRTSLITGRYQNVTRAAIVRPHAAYLNDFAPVRRFLIEAMTDRNFRSFLSDKSGSNAASLRSHSKWLPDEYAMGNGRSSVSNTIILTRRATSVSDAISHDARWSEYPDEGWHHAMLQAMKLARIDHPFFVSIPRSIWHESIAKAQERS